MLNDAGKQPRAVAFFGNKLYYSDSAFDKIEVAEMTGSEGQVPDFTDFRTNIDQLVNMKIVNPGAGAQ